MRLAAILLVLAFVPRSSSQVQETKGPSPDVPHFTHNRFTEDGKTFSQDGSAIVTDCLSEKLDVPGYELCVGYVEGIADLLSDESIICVPPEVEAKVLASVILRYAEKHQEMLHQPANRIVLNALKEKYSCAR